METEFEKLDTFKRALEHRWKGHRLVIVQPGTKTPAFKGWQRAAYTDDELGRLLAGMERAVCISSVVCPGAGEEDPGRLFQVEGSVMW